MIPRMTIWTHKGTHPATCPKKRTMIGITATMTWPREISSTPKGWQSAWMSRVRLNTWQGSLRCKCQGCGGCLRLAKREQSTPRSKGLLRVHTTMTWDATPTSLSLIGMVSYYHQMNIKFLNLRMFGQGPSGRSKSAPNTFVIWRSNARDIVYRCFSLAFNCKYISFARTGLNLGRHGYVVNVSAIIANTDPGKCDGPLLDWCIRKGHWLADERYKKYARAREAQHNLDEEFPSTYCKDGHCGPNCVMQKRSNIAFTAWRGLDPIHSQQYIDSIMRWVRARPHPSPATY